MVFDFQELNKVLQKSRDQDKNLPKMYDQKYIFTLDF